MPTNLKYMKCIKIEIKIDNEMIKNLLYEAGTGSKYWSENSLEYESVVKKVMTGGNITIKDLEEEKEYILNASMFRKGLTIIAKKYSSHFSDILKDDTDAMTGDAFLQCCLLGDIIYG